MKEKILIVDDNEMVLEIMCYILTSKGYEVSALNSGENVIAKVNQTRPDLVILDLNLGDMNGGDICKTLKESDSTKHTPVIICSAKDDADEALTQDGPPDAVLHKPFDISDFIEKVEYQLAA